MHRRPWDFSSRGPPTFEPRDEKPRWRRNPVQQQKHSAMPRHRSLYTLAKSGEMSASWGVPTSVLDHWLASETPALSHFWIRRRIRWPAGIPRPISFDEEFHSVHSGLKDAVERIT